MIQTDAALITAANLIKNETSAGANTASRVGQMLLDLVDSKISRTPATSLANAATTGALPSNNRSGNTLTASANGALTSASTDGVTPFVGMRIIVKNESNKVNNGLYTLTQIGTAGTPWIMDRATDADASAEFTAGSLWSVANGSGTVNGGRTFALVVQAGFVLNTHDIDYFAYGGQGTYNVKDFGAVGDGTTNDTTAIVNAKTAAIATGGILYFPRGIYSTDNFTIANAIGVVIRGDGPSASIIKARQAGGIVTFDTCTECGIEEIAIERKDSLFQTAGGYSLTFTDICVRCWTDNIRISYCAAGILLERAFWTHLRGKTTIDHVNGGGGSGAFRCVGIAGAGIGYDAQIDWLDYETFYPTTPTTYQGARANSTAYTVGQVVAESDLFWICTTAGTSAGSPPAAMSSRPGTDGPSAYTTGVTDGTVTWKFLIGNNFMFDFDFGMFNVTVDRYDCRGICVRPILMRRSNGAEQNPSGLTIKGGRIEQSLFAPLLENGSRVRWFNPDISRVWTDAGIICSANFTGDVQIHGGKVELAYGAGLFIDCDDVEVFGTKVLDCSQQASAAHHGVVVGNDDDNVRLYGLHVSGSLHSYGIGFNDSVTNSGAWGCYTPTAVNGGISRGTSTSLTLANNRGKNEEFRPPLPGLAFGGFITGNATLDSATIWVHPPTDNNARTVTLGTAGVADDDKRVYENRSGATDTESVTGKSMPTGFGYVFDRQSGAWVFLSRYIL